MAVEIPDSHVITRALQSSIENSSQAIEKLLGEAAEGVPSMVDLLRLVDGMATIVLSADRRINELEQRLEELEGRPRAASLEDQTKETLSRLRERMHADLIDSMFPRSPR